MISWLLWEEFPDPALHLRNKISDTHHQSSHCPRKLWDHTKHHHYDHANRKYNRKEKTYRSCQFYTYLIFFLPFQKFSFPKAHWHVGHKCDRSAKYKMRSPYCFQHIEHHIKLPQSDHKNAVNTISSRIFLQIFYLYPLSFSSFS